MSDSLSVRLVTIDKLPPFERLDLRPDGVVNRVDGKRYATPAKWHGAEVLVHGIGRDERYIVSIVTPHPSFPMSYVYHERGERRVVNANELKFLPVENEGESFVIAPTNNANNERLELLEKRTEGLQSTMNDILAAVTRPVESKEG